MESAPAAPAASSSSAAVCPQCGRAVVPGSIHCIKCGFLLDAPADDPDRPLKKVFKWWLIFYGFWRVWAVVVYSLAAFRNPVGGDAWLIFLILSLLAALSLFAIGMLWQGRQWALFIFICAELAKGFLELLLGDIKAPVLAIVAIAIMSFVGVRAKFQRA